MGCMTGFFVEGSKIGAVCEVSCGSACEAWAPSKMSPKSLEAIRAIVSALGWGGSWWAIGAVESSVCWGVGATCLGDAVAVNDGNRLVNCLLGSVWLGVAV